MKKITNESEFKKWFRKNWNGWVESYEPRRGGGSGVGDLQVIVDGEIVPLELKVGKVENGLLFPEKVRGVQISWHRRLKDEGIVSAFVVCDRNSAVLDSLALLVDPDHIVDWRKGIDICLCVPLFDLTIDLSDAVVKRRKRFSFSKRK